VERTKAFPVGPGLLERQILLDDLHDIDPLFDFVYNRVAHTLCIIASFKNTTLFFVIPERRRGSNPNGRQDGRPSEIGFPSSRE
jgi:hypothetical protein